MSKYQNGLERLAKHLATDGSQTTVVLLGGSASHVEADLAAIGSYPKIVKSPPRQCLTDYVVDVEAVTHSQRGQVMVVEDHSLTNGKALFIGEHLPDVQVVSIVGKQAIRTLPNCQVLEIDPAEADMLHRRRSTPPADKK
jgi:hypothetical protein